PTFHQEGPVADLHVMTATGTQTVVDETRLQTLKSTLRGELLRPGDAGYDGARTVFNAMIDRRPGLIARCGGAADVVECVRFARMHALLLSVRGTGHNVGGLSVCDGGFMIDLSHMKGIRVDPAARSARVEGGVTWGELNDELQAFGLAATGGFVSTTGVSGLTLGGGLGWLVRKHGLALDNLLSVEIVTADGELRTASLDSNPDLFWALRGGGGNFGVVTSFEFRVHAAGTVLAGLVIHPLAKAAEALRFWREFASSAMTTMVIEHNGDSAYSRIGEDETAFGHREWPYNFLVTSMWKDRTDSDRNVRWTREFWEAMRPHLVDAVYVNYLGEEGPNRIRDAYGAEKYARLAGLKARYDPTNLFRSNQNIRPDTVGV